jgi:Protein of unknown function (DUF3060)
MKRILGLSLALALVVPAAALAGSDFVVSDSHHTITHDCGKQPAVMINGSMNTISVSGACTKVLINGRGNTVAVVTTGKILVSGAANVVQVGATDKIELTGARNKVTWKRGLTRKRPKVADLGNHNAVTRAK